MALAVAAAALFSTSSIFVLLAAPVSPYEITFWRMVLAAGTAGAGMLAARTWKPFPRDRRYVLFGLVAALHFLAFVASLSFTTIAHALSITYLAPVFTGLAAWRLFGEKLSPRQLAGIVVALVGIGVLVGFEPRLDGRMLLGDGLALVAALAYAAYSLAGRGERARYPLLPYATAVYGLAALWLLPAFAVSFALMPHAYSAARVLALMGAGIVPLGLGHTLYNASLRRMPATYANLIASQEVTGGVLLGALLLGQVPPPSALAGAALAIAGIALLLWRA